MAKKAVIERKNPILTLTLMLRFIMDLRWRGVEMKIGELAKVTGVSVRSIRYYEQRGLMISTRLPNGYREYNSLAVEQVNAIQFYLSLGLTTEQVSSFLHCVIKNREAFCEEVLPIYKKKMAEIDDQIKLLSGIRSNLEERIEYIQKEKNGGNDNELTNDK